MDFIESVIAANREIHELISIKKESFYQKNGHIGAGGDISLGIDMAAEEIFIKYLGSFGKIDSEESGIIGSGKTTIYIDPMDGSSNFASNFPYFGTSIAFERDGKVEIGIICNLATTEIFIKTKDSFKRGFLYGNDFKDVTKNSYSKIGIFEKSYAYPLECSKLNQLGLKYRSPGAGAISLAMTHDVLFLLYLGKRRDYDAKAGLFMCEDLFCEIDESFLLISQNKEIFDSIKRALGR